MSYASRTRYPRQTDASGAHAHPARRPAALSTRKAIRPHKRILFDETSGHPCRLS